MKTWNDYKEHVHEVDPETSEELELTEEYTRIISTMIQRRNELGLSQRGLADLCDISLSTVEQIESQSMVPRLDTVLRMCKKLELQVVLHKNEQN